MYFLFELKFRESKHNTDKRRGKAAATLYVSLFLFDIFASRSYHFEGCGLKNNLFSGLKLSSENERTTTIKEKPSSWLLTPTCRA